MRVKYFGVLNEFPNRWAGGTAIKESRSSSMRSSILSRSTSLASAALASVAAVAITVTGPAKTAFAQQPQPVPTGKSEKQPVAIQLPSPLTLPQAIDLALQLQPNLASAVASRERTEQQEKGAMARYFPSITPTYTYLNQYSFGTVNQFIGNGVVVPVQSGQTNTNKQLQIGLSYRLYDSGVRDLNARSARQSVYAQEYAEQTARQTVIFNVADTYFSVLRNDALVTVSQSQVDRAKNTLDVITAQVEAGVGARKDILQAQADYLNAQVNLLSAQNNAAVAQANLKNALGLVGGQALKLTPVNAPTAQTPVVTQVPGVEQGAYTVAIQTDDVKTLNTLTEAAFKSRPDVAQSEKGLELSKTSVKQSQVNAGLVVNADVSANEQFQPTHFDSNIGRNRQINIGVSYPLFDAGLARSQVRSNQAGVRVSEAQLIALKQQVAVDVEQSYRNLLQARASIPAAEAAQAAAQINYEAALESRKEGVGSIVDVITAQTSLVQAQTNYVQAIYNFYGADARLARAVGQAERIAQIGK